MMAPAATVIVFFKREDADCSDEDPDKERNRVVMRGSFVFNANQVDGWHEDEEPQGETMEHLEVVEQFIGLLGATIRYGGDAAYYHKPLDQIRMPDQAQFAGTGAWAAAEAFYSVLLHELVHWSGHPKRLNRDLSGRFGTSAYAMEELIVEFGAAFLCADLGISVHPRRDHAAYVASWLLVLRRHKTAIVTAAGQATTACRYLREISLEKQRAA
jgi:antirestriction protein ArdC